VFELSTANTLTTLHSFDSSDGSSPNGLLQATDGNFYGTAGSGGTSLNSVGGCGVIFKLSSKGLFSVLHNFDVPFGANPGAGLFQDTNGIFYGTTEYGGRNGYTDAGTVFSLSVGLGAFVATVPTSGPEGSVITILGSDLTGRHQRRFQRYPG
jgi:uncharacterized repeat protein (TIGR03803 family)